MIQIEKDHYLKVMLRVMTELTEEVKDAPMTDDQVTNEIQVFRTALRSEKHHFFHLPDPDCDAAVTTALRRHLTACGTTWEDISEAFLLLSHAVDRRTEKRTLTYSLHDECRKASDIIDKLHTMLINENKYSTQIGTLNFMENEINKCLRSCPAETTPCTVPIHYFYNGTDEGRQQMENDLYQQKLILSAQILHAFIKRAFPHYRNNWQFTGHVLLILGKLHLETYYLDYRASWSKRTFYEVLPRIGNYLKNKCKCKMATIDDIPSLL